MLIADSWALHCLVSMRQCRMTMSGWLDDRRGPITNDASLSVGSKVRGWYTIHVLVARTHVKTASHVA